MVFLNCLIDESTAIEEQINKEAGLGKSGGGGGGIPNTNEPVSLYGLEDIKPTPEQLERFRKLVVRSEEILQQRKELKLKKQQQKVGKK